MPHKYTVVDLAPDSPPRPTARHDADVLARSRPSPRSERPSCLDTIVDLTGDSDDEEDVLIPVPRKARARTFIDLTGDDEDDIEVDARPTVLAGRKRHKSTSIRAGASEGDVQALSSTCSASGLSRILLPQVQVPGAQSEKAAATYPTPPLSPPPGPLRPPHPRLDSSHSSAAIPTSLPASHKQGSAARPAIASTPSQLPPHGRPPLPPPEGSPHVRDRVLASWITLKHAPGKGRGVFLTRDIKRGEVVIAERPFLRVKIADLENEAAPKLVPYWTALGNALEPLQRLFHSFETRQTGRIIRTSGSEDRSGNELMREILNTNGIPLADCVSGSAEVEEVEPVETGMFEYISRINHSCAPNCTWRWNAGLSAMIVTAYQDMPAGTEVTASYLDDSCLIRKQRQSDIKHLFGFACACERCSMVGEALQDSERRLKRYRQLLDGTRCKTRRFEWEERTKGYSARVLRELDDMEDILREEGRHGAILPVLQERWFLHVFLGQAEPAISAGRRMREQIELERGQAVALSWRAWVEKPEDHPEWASLIRKDWAGASDSEDEDECVSEIDDRRRSGKRKAGRPGRSLTTR